MKVWRLFLESHDFQDKNIEEICMAVKEITKGEYATGLKDPVENGVWKSKRTLFVGQQKGGGSKNKDKHDAMRKKRNRG